MKIYVVGNPIVREDSIVIRLLPKLRMAFQHIDFKEVDPNENFVPESNSIIMDTVKGLNDVRWFDGVDDFSQTRSVSPHDYDVGLHLRLLLKLKKINTIKILGIPSRSTPRIIKDVVRVLRREMKTL